MIIDANIIVCFYIESFLKKSTECSSSVKNLMDSITTENPVYLDIGGIIESEWRSVNDCEWFDGWYSDLLISGKAELITPTKNSSIKSNLIKLGFPRNSRDILYIRTAESVVLNKKKPHCHLKTEDLDFYDPTKKKTAKGAKRIRILNSKNAPVRKFLRKKHRILTSPLP